MQQLQTVDADTLLYEPLEKPSFVVDGLIPTGLSLFCGSQKIGKSWLMLKLCLCVSQGIPLWDMPTLEGDVLYLCLEDTFCRIQDRLFRLTDEASGRLHFAVASCKLSDGLIVQLEDYLKEYPQSRLIVIDTLQKIREAGGEKFSYANDYEIVGRLKQFADYHNICLLLVHHTRKQQSDDKFDMISGTNGLLGAADGAFILQKTKRIDNKGILDIVGRDQQDQKLYLEFDREKCLWKFIKMETELCKEPLDPIVKMVGEMVTKNKSDWIGSASELAVLLPKEISPNALTRRLNVNAERLLEEFNIYYESSRNRTGRQIKLTLTKK